MEVESRWTLPFLDIWPTVFVCLLLDFDIRMASLTAEIPFSLYVLVCVSVSVYVCACVYVIVCLCV